MTTTVTASPTSPRRAPWNKGKLIGAKPLLRIKHVWPFAARCNWQAAFAIWRCSISASLAKLRGCGLVSLRVPDVAPLGRAIAREAVDAYLRAKGRHVWGYLFPDRGGAEPIRAPANMRDCWIAGCIRSVSIPRSMARTCCAGPRPP